MDEAESLDVKFAMVATELQEERQQHSNTTEELYDMKIERNDWRLRGQRAEKIIRLVQESLEKYYASGSLFSIKACLNGIMRVIPKEGER